MSNNGPKRYLKVGTWGAVITAICCFTPILVLGLGIVGLGMLIPYLDYLLLPALGLFLLLIVFGLCKESIKAEVMAECCGYPKKRVRTVCPKNGKVCKPVPQITVKTLIKPEQRRSLTAMPYSFCDSPDCDVVYVSASGEQVITKNQLQVRVGIKETEDPIPLCYCFDFDRRAIWNDIRSKGRTDIPGVISERVKAGECRCEFTNPRGSCCLGDIYRAVKQAHNKASAPLLALLTHFLIMRVILIMT